MSVGSGTMMPGAQTATAPADAANRRRKGRAGMPRAVLCAMLAAASITPGAAPAQSADAAPRGQERSPAAPGTLTLVVGDRVKVMVYERLADAEDRWANQQRAARPDATFHLHQGISGEVSVRSDWRISVPLLGAFVAAGRDPGELAADLARAFERLTGRRATVNIEMAERPPIYVLGPVRQPGTFRFEAGLTPLHALALAGGLRVQEADRALALEAMRELGRSEIAGGRLQRALARRTVLRAQLEGHPAVAPDALLQLVGYARAQAMMAEEGRMREQILRARQERDRSFAASVAAAEIAADAARARLAPLRANVEQRRTRFEGIERLFNSGTVHRVQLSQAQSELSDAVDREAMAQSDLAEAERLLRTLQLEQAKYRTDAVAADEGELAALDREIEDLDTTMTSSVRLAGMIGQDLASAARGTPSLRFEVVRRSAGGGQVLVGEPTMLLEPGDLVRVFEAGASPQHYARSAIR